VFKTSVFRAAMFVLVEKIQVTRAKLQVNKETIQYKQTLPTLIISTLSVN